MSETTARGNGVIVDRPSAGKGTLPRSAPAGRPAPSARPAEVPRQGKSRQDRERGRPAPERSSRQRAAQQRQARPDAKAAPPRPAPGQSPAGKPAPGHTAPEHVAASAIPAGLRRVAPSAANRMPFMVLLCGLLGGALVSALVISTTLDKGSFEISKLQQSDNALARQRQELQDEVAQAQSAPVIQQRAYELGMRPVSRLQFVNLKSGKIVTNAGSGAVAHINVPGYTP
ncbi:MAG TPA: hypothetical protein VF060_01465 [Trebonia sp.]